MRDNPITWRVRRAAPDAAPAEVLDRVLGPVKAAELRAAMVVHVDRVLDEAAAEVRHDEDLARLRGLFGNPGGAQ